MGEMNLIPGIEPLRINREIPVKYYTIQETSKKTGIAQFRIRFYHDYFKLQINRKDNVGNRKFQDKDIETLKNIKAMAAYFHLDVIKSFKLYHTSRRRKALFGLFESAIL